MVSSFFTFLFLSPLLVHAMSFEHPAEEAALKQKSNSLELVKKSNLKLPPDEKLLYAVSEDLNGDGIADLVAVTRTKNDEANLLIYLLGKKDSLKPVYSSTTTLGCCEGNLGFTGTPLIKNNILSIIYESSGVGAFSSMEFKLRWNKRDSFKVIGYTFKGTQCDNAVGNCKDEASVDINFSTKKMIMGKQTCKISADSADLSLDDISEGYKTPKCLKK